MTSRERISFAADLSVQIPSNSGYQSHHSLTNFLSRDDVVDALAEYFRTIPSALVADALGEGAGALAGDVHEAGIARDLIEHGQEALRFRQKAAVKIRLELQQGVVDSQPVVSHAPRNEVDMLLLPRQALKNLQELGGPRIWRALNLRPAACAPG